MIVLLLLFFFFRFFFDAKIKIFLFVIFESDVRKGLFSNNPDKQKIPDKYF